MSKLVFASFLKIFKDAMSYRLNKNDIIIKLYDIVLDLVKERQPQVAPVQATRIFDCEEEVNTNVSKHAYDQLVLDSLKCSVDSVIFGEMSNKNKTQFIQRLKDIIIDDSTIPYEEKERLLRYADEKEYELFVGYSLLYSFSVPNVPVTDTAKKKS